MKDKQPIKLLFTGPESTGKSTIASYVAEKWNLTLIKEYAREYLQQKNDAYTKTDLLYIAKKHHQIVEEQAVENNILVLDTYLLNIKIWSEYKYGSCDSWIKNSINSLLINHVFLTSPDVPWFYDPQRENKDNRSELFDIFQKELNRLNWPFTILDDDKDMREKQMDELVKQFN